MADPECAKLGIPEKLHTDDRPAMPLDDPEERLFRRYKIPDEENLTACIKFGDMSVNREKLATDGVSLPEDVLIDDETGEAYENCGVAGFVVGSLRSMQADGCWRLDGVPGAFELRPRHVLTRCNYAHVQVEVFKDGLKQSKIKPPTIKLAIRQHLESRITVVHPTDSQGKHLPLV